jgi:hypothetical protein
LAPSQQNTVSISGVQDGSVTGQGPGAVNGDAVIFTVTVTNNSSATITLNVAITANGSTADPDPQSSNPDGFSGTLAPGASQTRTYAAKVPNSARAAGFPIVVNYTATQSVQFTETAPAGSQAS